MSIFDDNFSFFCQKICFFCSKNKFSTTDYILTRFEKHEHFCHFSIVVIKQNVFQKNNFSIWKKIFLSTQFFFTNHILRAKIWPKMWPIIADLKIFPRKFQKVSPKKFVIDLNKKNFSGKIITPIFSQISFWGQKNGRKCGRLWPI